MALFAGVELFRRGADGHGFSGDLGYAPAALLVTPLLLAAGITLVWAMTNRLGLAAWVTGGVAFGLLFLHARKMAALSAPLTPWDLALGRQVLALAPSLASPGLLLALAGTVACWTVVAVWLSRRRPERPLRPYQRVTCALSVVLLAHFAILHRPEFVRAHMEEEGLVNLVWNPLGSVERNGLLLDLVLNTDSLAVETPGASPAEIEAWLAPYREGVVVAQGAGLTPDVVLYLGEAFWDPLQLGIPLSRDPMPSFRRLLAMGGGTAVSSQYGGGTANVEFELLTGIPTAVLPNGAYPFQHYLDRPLEALPALFRARGYRTLAVHPFHRWFWGRSTAFPLLGFERFLALDDLEPIRREGPFPSDEPLVDRVLAELAEPGRPVFVLAISVVSHGPFGYVPPPGQTIRITNTEKVRPQNVRILENYVNALERADRALGRLSDALAHRARTSPASGRG